MIIHHVLTILTLTFIQGHTDLDLENNKCLIISENIQAMLVKFTVKIVGLKVYMTIARPMTFNLHSRLQVRLKLDYFLTCNISDNI